MSMPKNTEKIKRIFFYRDEDGRTFEWISKREKTSVKNIRKVYYREKALKSVQQRKEINASYK